VNQKRSCPGIGDAGKSIVYTGVDTDIPAVVRQILDFLINLVGNDYLIAVSQRLNSYSADFLDFIRSQLHLNVQLIDYQVAVFYFGILVGYVKGMSLVLVQVLWHSGLAGKLCRSLAVGF